MKSLILASASPRRAQLLKQIGLPFRVEKSNFRELPLNHADMVEEVALAKAEGVQQRFPGELILGADTVVVFGTEVFGKPRNDAEAAAMLSSLSGNVHRVITGMALLQGKSSLTAKEETLVWMRPFDAEEIKAYIATGEPFDKAGAYGIQGRGAVFVERIAGCYFNVVGLPLSRLVLMLREFAWPLWEGGICAGEKTDA